MWYSIVLGSKMYALKSVNSVEKKTMKVSLFDMENVWFEEISADASIERCRSLNPSLEFNEASIHTLIDETLTRLSSTNKDIRTSFTACCYDSLFKFLSLEVGMGGVPFKYEFHLRLMKNSNMMYNEVTLPLLQSLHDFDFKQKKLIEIIKKKDVEINQYKMEGATLLRRNVITGPFEEGGLLQACGENVDFEHFNTVNTFTKNCLDRKAINTELMADLPQNTSNPSTSEDVTTITSPPPLIIDHEEMTRMSLKATRQIMAIEEQEAKRTKITPKANLNL